MTAFAIFVIAVLVFVFSQVVTYASRRVPVRDKDGHVIGEAWIPHDYGADASSAISLAVLSGIQLWTIRTIGKAAHERNPRPVPNSTWQLTPAVRFVTCCTLFIGAAAHCVGQSAQKNEKLWVPKRFLPTSFA